MVYVYDMVYIFLDFFLFLLICGVGMIVINECN